MQPSLKQSPPVQLWYFGRTEERFVEDLTRPQDLPPGSSRGKPLPSDGQYGRVSSHFLAKMTLFFSMVSWILLVVVRTSCQCFSVLASIQRICVIWALHSTSVLSTYKRRVLEDIKHLLITLLTWDSNFIILGRSQSAMAVPCLITWVAWCRQLLGAFQSRTPMRNNDNKEASLIFV